MHRALILWPDGVERETYVKMAYPPPGRPDRQLINEGIGWFLAQICNLPVPPHAGYMMLPSAVLAAAHPDVPSSSDGELAWLCSAEPHRALIVNQGDAELSEMMMMELSRWRHLHATLALDEWIANDDRHWRNLIRRAPGDFVLIDHDNAFTGPNWLADHLFARRSEDFPNRLYGSMENFLSHSSEIRKLSSAMLPAAEAFKSQLSDNAEEVTDWLTALLDSDEDQWSLAAFIAYRAKETANAIKRRYQLLT